MMQQKATLDNAIRNRNTDDFWKQWSVIVVQAFVQFLELTGPIKTRAKRHGRPMIHKEKAGHHIGLDGKVRNINPWDQHESQRLLGKQLSRLKQIASIAHARVNCRDQLKQHHDMHSMATCTSFCNVDANIDSNASHEAAVYFGDLAGALPLHAPLKILLQRMQG